MNRRLGIVVALIVAALLYSLSSSDSASSQGEFVALVQKETRRKTLAMEQPISVSRVSAKRETVEEEAEGFTVRPAIVELAEFTWDTTRKWNLPLNNPPLANGYEALFLKPDDYVLGVLLGRKARAYPWMVLANYHSINDHIGSKAVIVTLCEACNGGAAFLAKTEHATIDLRPCGVKNGTWYGVDFQTGSHWYPFAGKAFDGPLKGTKLTRIRAYFCTWRQWLDEHPETTVVLASDEVRDRPHGSAAHMANDQTFNPRLLARLGTTPNPKSDLLPAAELIYGLIPSGDAKPKAYRLSDLREAKTLVQTEIDDVPVVLVIEDQYQVGAYVRRIGDREIQLTLVSKQPLVMADQYGNQWNAWGRKISGPDYQAELPIADGYLTKWYEWLENYPETELASIDTH